MKRDAVDVSVPSREVLQHRSALNTCQAYLAEATGKLRLLILNPQEDALEGSV